MGRFFITLGMLVLLLGLGSALLSETPEAQPPTPRTQGLESLVQSGLSGAQRAAITEAERASDALNEAGASSRATADWLMTVVFVLGAATTITLGLQQMLPSATRWRLYFSVAIGLLGVASSVTTAGAQYLRGQADASFQCVESINREIRDAIDELRRPGASANVERTLRELAQRVERCQR